MDYFDCDYFDQTYFDTPDCPPVVAAGGHRVGRPRPRLVDVLPDEADELVALL
jgi:hypothetical protein